MSRSRVLRSAVGGLLVLAMLIVVAVVIAVAQGRRTPSGRAEYVALGSSFAAGAGLGRLEPGSPLLCARSVSGYPQRLARLGDRSIVDMSCGGAVTRHLLSGGQVFQGPQIRTIRRETRLVTITVGGNDVGYVGDMSMLAARREKSVFGWLIRTFWKGPEAPEARDYAGFRAELTATLKAIHQRSPEATVVVATYPALMPPIGTCARIGLSESETALMRQVGDRLAGATRAAARDGRAILVDMHVLGAANHACSASPWTSGWSSANGAPFHPTQLGAEATARAISDALTSVVEPKEGRRGLSEARH